METTRITGAIKGLPGIDLGYVSVMEKSMESTYHNGFRVGGHGVAASASFACLSLACLLNFFGEYREKQLYWEGTFHAHLPC